MGMPKSRKKKAEPAQVNTGDASSSTAPQTTARPAEAAAQSCSEPSPPAFMSEDAPDPKKRRVVMYVEPGEVAVVRKEISLPPVPSGAYMQRVRDRELEEQRYHAALCNNLWCDCADRGVALLGQYDMFCQLYKCYAAEIGCCTLGRDSLDMDMHCMHKGIIIDYTPSLQMCAQPNFREGRHIPLQDSAGHGCVVPGPSLICHFSLQAQAWRRPGAGCGFERVWRCVSGSQTPFVPFRLQPDLISHTGKTKRGRVFTCHIFLDGSGTR